MYNLYTNLFIKMKTIANTIHVTHIFTKMSENNQVQIKLSK